MSQGKWVFALLSLSVLAMLAGCHKPVTPNVTVVLTTEGGGSLVTDPPGNSHAAGTVLTITAVALPGTHFDHWAGGLGGTLNPTTVTVTADMTITAVFAPDSHTLAYAAGAGGTLQGNAAQTVLYGGTGTAVTAVPDTGWHFDRWSDGVTTATRTDANVTVDLAVTAEFAIDLHTLQYTAGSHGTLNGAAEQTVPHGGTGTAVTAVPDIGWHFDRWSDGVTTATRTDANVTADLAVTAEFAIDLHTLQYTAGDHGTLDGAAEQTVPHGGSGTAVTAVPDAHCHFVRWSDGVATAARTDTNVTADLAVTAEFAWDTRTLAYAAGEHGRIDGAAAQTVDYGTDGAPVTAVPDTGYHFTQWSDGVTTATRTDTGVTEDLAVTAAFAINRYTLSYTAGANGTLSGDTSQTVDHGGSGTAVTAVPDQGFHFVQWSDGFTAATRTDTAVTGDVSVSAEFGAGVVLHVDGDSAAAAPDGLSWETAYPDIQSAVYAAPPGAQVWVTGGTYTSTEGAVLNLRTAVLVYGGFAGTEVYRDQRDWSTNRTIIDGENARMCVSGADDAALDGFTITGGHADNGGGMCNTLTSPVIARCVFAGNYATTNGGGLANFGGSPLIEDCVFQGNTSDGMGGGLSSANPGNVVLRRCVFSRNSALNAAMGGFGGAVFCDTTAMTLEDCLIADNAAYTGAGVIASSCTLTVWGSVFARNSAQDMAGALGELRSLLLLNGCVFSENTALSGAACYMIQGGGAADNCIFLANRADDEGGAIRTSAADLNMRNCTFTRNAAAEGGALYSGSVEYLTNCILWNNTAGGQGPEIYSGGGQIPQLSYCCVQGGFAGLQNIDADPLFVDAENGILYLGPGSPCIDSGTDSNAPDTDFGGRTRPAGAGVDMGAHEGAVAEADLVTLTLQALPAHGGRLWPGAGVHRCVRGEPVLISATPDGMRFAGWVGDVTDGRAVVRVIMDGDKTVTATFALNTVYVNAAAKGAADGTSWATAYPDIQTAVDAAPKDGTGEVWVAEGTYTAATEQVVALRPGILLYGGFAGNETDRDQRDCSAHPSVIDGAKTRCGVLGADRALIDGFTVANGTGPWGGGMLNDNTSPTVRNCVFTGNIASYGGAMACRGAASRPLVADCTFEANGAGDGGALYSTQASVAVAGCAFVRNRAQSSGGGAYAYGAEVSFSDCTFAHNTAQEGGGGLYGTSTQSMSVDRCVFAGNETTVGEGGGFYNESIQSLTANCLFLRNRAMGMRGYGGGMRPSSGGTDLLKNCTFTQNEARCAGALGGDTRTQSLLIVCALQNCILWGDKALAGPEIYLEGGAFFPMMTTCCLQGAAATADPAMFIGADPLFVDGDAGSVQLMQGSPCIDTGTAAGAPATDLLGRPRPAGAGVDMGAFEGAVSEADLVTLTIQTAPADGGHTVPEAGTHTFARGDTARMTALPLGMRFDGWTGDTAETAQDLALVMDGDKTVTATFAPNVLYVNAAHTGTADGRSWATAFPSVPQALKVAEADPGGEVWVAEGYYQVPTETGLTLRPGVYLYGGFAGTEKTRDQRRWEARPTVLVGPGQFGCTLCGADDTVIDGFTVAKGSPGLSILSCSPRIVNCLFTQNDGSNGAGIANQYGSPVVLNCRFEANTGRFTNNGCITNSSGTLVARDCVFSGNAGLGIYNGNAEMTVTGCRFENNGLGGIRNMLYAGYGCVVTISGCTFTGNAFFGGIATDANMDNDAQVFVSNCVFVKNTADLGAGVSQIGGKGWYTNCTFTLNTGSDASSKGGGLYLERGTATLANCILWGNSAATGPEVHVSSGTLAARYSCLPAGFGTEGVFYLDPLLADAANGNVRLLPGSPCIDAGTADGAPGTDLDGVTRPQGAGVDIGAYEQ